jgi:hypothetical protein
MACAVDWSSLVLPDHCLEGGFHTRLLLRGIGPLLPMVAVCVIGVIRGRLSHYRRHGRKSKVEGRRSNDIRQLTSSLQTTLPLVLFIAFVLIGPVSSSIFAAWTCETFTLDSIANPPTTIAFLVADLSLSKSGGTELRCVCTPKIDLVCTPIVWQSAIPRMRSICR